MKRYNFLRNNRINHKTQEIYGCSTENHTSKELHFQRIIHPDGESSGSMSHEWQP